MSTIWNRKNFEKTFVNNLKIYCKNAAFGDRCVIIILKAGGIFKALVYFSWRGALSAFGFVENSERNDCKNAKRKIVFCCR